MGPEIVSVTAHEWTSSSATGSCPSGETAPNAAARPATVPWPSLKHSNLAALECPSLPPPTPVTNERIDRIEERLAWFERHVAEQDKEMLDLAKRLDRTQAELRLLRERAASAETAPATSPADDRPPHY